MGRGSGLGGQKELPGRIRSDHTSEKEGIEATADEGLTFGLRHGVIELRFRVEVKAGRGRG